MRKNLNSEIREILSPEEYEEAWKVRRWLNFGTHAARPKFYINSLKDLYESTSFDIIKEALGQVLPMLEDGGDQIQLKFREAQKAFAQYIIEHQ